MTNSMSPTTLCLGIVRQLKTLTLLEQVQWTPVNPDDWTWVTCFLGELKFQIELLYPVVEGGPEPTTGPDAVRLTLGSVDKVTFGGTQLYEEGLEILQLVDPNRRRWTEETIVPELDRVSRYLRELIGDVDTPSGPDP